MFFYTSGYVDEHSYHLTVFLPLIHMSKAQSLFIAIKPLIVAKEVLVIYIYLIYIFRLHNCCASFL